MTDQIRSYLEQVMRRSGLSKLEKAEWTEEMAAHLDDEVVQIMSCGFEESEATTLAVQKFGEPSILRRKISRDTFGLSVPTIVLLSAVCLTLFLVNCGVLVLLVQLGKPSQYNPNIFDMLRAVPMSPSLMLGLCLGFLSLLKTRCRAIAFLLFTFKVIDKYSIMGKSSTAS